MPLIVISSYLNVPYLLELATVVAVTCVGGNTILPNVLINVQRTLAVCGHHSTPVYSGASVGLIQPQHRDYWFGQDGLGDASLDGEDPSLYPPIQKEHAVPALIRMCRESLAVVERSSTTNGLRTLIDRTSIELAQRRTQLQADIQKKNFHLAARVQQTIDKLEELVKSASSLCRAFLGQSFEDSPLDLVATIDVLALGPLTNIALAIRMDPLFPLTVRSLVIMGGSEKRGNVEHKYNAEFNFYNDPEAVFIVLDSFPLSTMLTFEGSLKHGVTIEEQESWSPLNARSAKAQFRRKITRQIVAKCGPLYYSCDMIAALAYLDPRVIAPSAELIHMSVELAHGSVARGASLIDHSDNSVVPESKNVFLITEIDVAAYSRMMRTALE